MSVAVAPRQRRLVVATVLLGTLAVSLNNTALNPAIPVFIGAFGIDAVTASWVLTAFMVGMGMTMPVTGWLGDRCGRKRVYLAGLALFVAGSCVGSVAPTMAWVIAARCIQGVAGGILIPLSLALVFAVYPKEERGRIAGWWGMAVMLAPAVGPVLGGLVVQFAHWHWLFALNVPVGLAGLALGWHCLPAPAAAASRPFDWTGFALVTAGVGLLLATLSRIRGLATLAEPGNLALLAAAVLCLALFVRVELARSAPLMNLRIFGEPAYALSVAVVVAQSVGMFGCVVLLPLLMQTVLGFGATWTGVALFATALCAGLFSTVGGRLLDRHGPRAGVAWGLLCSALATAAFGLVGPGTPLWAVIALMAARGIGLALAYLPVSTAGLNAIPEHLVTEGSALNNIVRRVVASLAVVLVSIYFEVRRAALLAAGHADIAGSMTALHEIFVAIGLVILAAVPLALLFPKSDHHRPATAAAPAYKGAP